MRSEIKLKVLGIKRKSHTQNKTKNEINKWVWGNPAADSLPRDPLSTETGLGWGGNRIRTPDLSTLARRVALG